MIKIPLLIAILLLACITAVAQQPTDTSASRFQAGLDAQKAGQYEQALREYATALQLDPKNFMAQFNIAGCYAELGRWPEAAAAFKTAIALRPNEAMTYVGLGSVYAKMDRTTEAIDALKQALRLDPKVPLPGHGLRAVGKQDRRHAAVLHPREPRRSRSSGPAASNSEVRKSSHKKAQKHKKI